MLENRQEYQGGAYDIIWVAGQSNAEGYGLGDAAPYAPFVADGDILALRDTCGYRFLKDESGRDFLQLLGYPTVTKISVAEELLGMDGLPRASFALPFARAYKERYLAEGRRVLVVYTAVGGTCFARGEWGVDCLLSNRAVGMVKEALSLSEDSRIVALLWHQGESDAGRPNLTPDERYRTHKDHLSRQFGLFRDLFGRDFPILAGGFARSWADQLPTATDAVLRAIEDVLAEDGYGAMASSLGLLSNAQANEGNTDAIHFSRVGLHGLAERYFDLYRSLLDKTPAK